MRDRASLPIVVEGRDDIDRQLVVAAHQPVVELLGKGEILAGGLVPDLAALDHAVEDQRLQLLGDLGGIDCRRLDLLFDVLFLIGQEFEQLAIALDVGVLLEQTQRLFDRAAVLGLVDVEPLLQQDRDVARRRLERLDIFDQKQRLQDPRGEIVAEVASRRSGSTAGRWISARCGCPRTSDRTWRAGRPAYCASLDRHVLEHAQHRALADRAVLALEGVVLRQILDRQLKQRDTGKE